MRLASSRLTLFRMRGDGGQLGIGRFDNGAGVMTSPRAETNQSEPDGILLMRSRHESGGILSRFFLNARGETEIEAPLDLGSNNLSGLATTDLQTAAICLVPNDKRRHRE